MVVRHASRKQESHVLCNKSQKTAVTVRGRISGGLTTHWNGRANNRPFINCDACAPFNSGVRFAGAWRDYKTKPQPIEQT